MSITEARVLKFDISHNSGLGIEVEGNRCWIKQRNCSSPNYYMSREALQPLKELLDRALEILDEEQA